DRQAQQRLALSPGELLERQGAGNLRTDRQRAQLTNQIEDADPGEHRSEHDHAGDQGPQTGEQPARRGRQPADGSLGADRPQGWPPAGTPAPCAAGTGLVDSASRSCAGARIQAATPTPTKAARWRTSIAGVAPSGSPNATKPARMPPPVAPASIRAIAESG